ncbi:MAG: class I SAM-dependent methyltransferase, partial [Kovacikia sp.]
MDCQRFIDQLPELYRNWDIPSIQPVSAQFSAVLDQSGEPAVPNVLQLLNGAVGCMAAEEIYCEIGCGLGTYLIAALLNHADRLAYAVENPDQAGAEGEGIDRLMANLTRFDLQEQVFFCCQDMEEFFADLRDAGLEDKIGVYFYNGASDYRSQLLGLLLAKPFLADQALIV